MENKLKWKGLSYTVKPFTLGTLFSLWEGIATAAESGKTITGTFEIGCKVLLEGDTKEAQGFLISGALAKAVLTSEEVETAYAFKEQVDFFSNSYSDRGLKLKESAPDLKDKLAAKEPASLLQKRQKGSKQEAAHSG